MNVADIRQALNFVPPHDRQTWLLMGMAIKSELGDDGFKLWETWSQQDDSYNARDARAVWDSISPNGPVTIGTLIYEAKRHDYRFSGDARPHRPTIDELLERKRKADEVDADRARGHAKAQKKAIALWNAASPASCDHPYLKRKGIKTHGIRCNNWPQRGKRNCLLIPMFDAEGVLWNVQAIFPERDVDLDRDKDFFAGGKTRGCYYTIGEPGLTICVAEGYATAATIHEATRGPVAVAFAADNLGPVARGLRAKFPDAQIIVCADNDQFTKGNPGLTKASRAAQAVGALLAYPEFAL